MTDAISWSWTHNFLPELMNRGIIPLNVKTVLDVGCGRGIMGAMVRIYRDPKLLIGVDIFSDYVEECRKYKRYDQVFQMDITKGLPWADKSFDLVLCIEVIEHLTRKDALRLISELERVARRVVISTTRFLGMAVLDGNHNQLHQCELPPTVFKDRGYKIRGVGQMGWVRHGHPVMVPVLSSWTRGMSHLFPRACPQYIACKDLNEKPGGNT